MTNHVNGKVIIVTGAAGGFGRLVSRKAAALGGLLICADIDQLELGNTEKQITDAGGSGFGMVTDVRDPDQMHRLVEKTLALHGRVDVLVNNAGTMPLGFYSDHAAAVEAWNRCIDINFKGVLNGIVAVYDPMIRQGRGHVVNLSSIYGNYPVLGAGVYGATKAAVNFLSESLRVEAQGKIKVTTVRPTGVPATRLGSGIVNPEAIVGILGHKAPAYLQMMQAQMKGELPAELSNPDSIEYYALAPEYLADQIVYAIDQPWGVSIGDITVRASGDAYQL